MQKMQEAWKSYLKDSVKLADPMVDSVMAIRMQYMDVKYKSAGLTDDQIQQIHAHEDAMSAQTMNRMNNGGGGQ